MQLKLITAGMACTFLVCIVASQAQQAPAPNTAASNAASTSAVPAPALPGMTWESLQDLPLLIGSAWVPDAAPANELAYLKQITYPPLKDEALADARTIVESILKGDEELPTKTCVFDGMPRVVWYPYTIQFLYSPGNVMIQTHDVIRAVRMGSLEHSPAILDKDKLQGFDPYGDELGVWEGDTLVVDTRGTREDMDTFYGVANDRDLHVVERYRLLDKNKLERRVTIESPAYFKTAWELRSTYTRAAEQPWATQFCLPKKKSGAQ
ncbi:MAG: hypothetical protein QM808_14505 [Steroidobacteraceae bacterium]